MMYSTIKDRQFHTCNDKCPACPKLDASIESLVGPFLDILHKSKYQDLSEREKVHVAFKNLWARDMLVFNSSLNYEMMEMRVQELEDQLVLRKEELLAELKKEMLERAQDGARLSSVFAEI